MASNFKIFIVIANNTRMLQKVPVPLVQSVRFRKPRWLPKAKSKEFYVREPTPIDLDEHAQLEQSYKHYRGSVRGIRYFLKEHVALEKDSSVARKESVEAADFAWMEEETMKWNQKVGVQRELRQAEDDRLEKERLEKQMQEQAELRLQKALEAEKLLQKNKVASANFISREHLDEEIEKMLDSRSDYNFAVTKSGAKLPGEYPEKVPNKGNNANS